LLAGFNFPISEDLIIITGALICQEEPSLLVPVFAAIFAGAVISDYFPYYLGKYIRKGTMKGINTAGQALQPAPTAPSAASRGVLNPSVPHSLGHVRASTVTTSLRSSIKSRFAIRLAASKKLDRMHHYLEKYGIFTFIVCRFVPFGVRNTLFLSSGFFGLRLRRFALYDIIAATISVSTVFFLTYSFGESIKKPLHAVGIVLFVLILSTVGFIIFRVIRSIIYRK
jgi:membrane protein DedA with SNARE-associated domain